MNRRRTKQDPSDTLLQIEKHLRFLANSVRLAIALAFGVLFAVIAYVISANA